MQIRMNEYYQILQQMHAIKLIQILCEILYYHITKNPVVPDFWYIYNII